MRGRSHPYSYPIYDTSGYGTERGGIRAGSSPSGVIYYDATTKNSSTTDFVDDVFLNTSQNSRLIGNPKDYDVSIIRFKIPSESIPLLKKLYFPSLRGSFTMGSAVVTNVTSNDEVNFPLRNLALEMQLYTNFDTVSADSDAKITNITFTSPTIADITIGTNFLGPTGDYLFSASLYYVKARVMAPSTPTEVLRVFAPFTLGIDYESIIVDMDRTIDYAWFFAQTSIGFLYPAPFIYLDENSNLLSAYSITSTNGFNIQLLVSKEMYQLLSGIPTQAISVPSDEKYFRALNFFDTGYSSGLNVVSITPQAKLTSIVSDLSTTITTNLNDPFYVGASVTGTGIPAGTTVVSIAPTSAFSADVVLSHAPTILGPLVVNIADAPFSAYRMTQGYSSLYNWTPLKKIIITTSLIPVKSTVTQPLISLSANGEATASQSVSRPIMTDFEPLVQKQDYTPYQYFPQGPWRLIPMQGEEELRSLDLQTYWEDFNGNLNLFRVPPTQESSKLLAFVPRR